jgi:uncharacterized protein with von Willebrand factor type A (vWA) domain
VSEGGASGIDARLLELGDELRGEGMRVGTAELLDALAALGHVDWGDRGAFHGALAATLAKSPEERHVFDAVFERFFFRAVEAAALREGVSERRPGSEGAAALDLEELRAQLEQALRDFDEARLRDLARLAIAALGSTSDPAGVVGLDVQRIRRALGLRRSPLLGEDAGSTTGLPRDAIARFEALLRAELERDQIQRTEMLGPKRPLSELDRALPSGPAADLVAVHRVVRQLRRRLASRGRELHGQRHRGQVDFRRTLRASLQTGGVPVVIRERPQRPRRPELYVVCDVSTSVSSASVFFLSVLHALHDSFRRMRSFVFIERVSEVTDLFARERDFTEVSEAITREAGVADVSGFTDYGRVWAELRALVEDELDARSTIIVLGDARTNGRPPRADELAALAARAGRTLWLNPEPRLYWNYGDSVMAAYESCCEVFECWTARQLEEFVKRLTRVAPR